MRVADVPNRTFSREERGQDCGTTRAQQSGPGDDRVLVRSSCDEPPSGRFPMIRSSACAAGDRALYGLELLQVLSVERRKEWCNVQAHRSRLETRAKEYSMCASLRVSQNLKAK